MSIQLIKFSLFEHKDLENIYIFKYSDDEYFCYSVEELKILHDIKNNNNFSDEQKTNAFIRSTINFKNFKEEDFEEIAKIIRTIKKDNNNICKKLKKTQNPEDFENVIKCLQFLTEDSNYIEFVRFFENDIQDYPFSFENAFRFINLLEEHGINLNLHNYEDLQEEELKVYLASSIAYFIKNSPNKDITILTINNIFQSIF